MSQHAMLHQASAAAQDHVSLKTCVSSSLLASICLHSCSTYYGGNANEEPDVMVSSRESPMQVFLLCEFVNFFI